jgi:hypothetical protein
MLLHEDQQTSRAVEIIQNLRVEWKSSPEAGSPGPPEAETVAWRRGGRRRSTCCCKSLRSNTELVVRQSLASKDVNTEGEEVTALKAVTRQPVKTQQTEKT